MYGSLFFLDSEESFSGSSDCDNEVRVPFLSLSIDITFSLINHFLPPLVDSYNLRTAAIVNVGYPTRERSPTPHIKAIMSKFNVGA